MPPTATAHLDTSVWRATGSEPPVFLDETGRRRPRMLALAAASGLIAVVWLAGVVGGGLGFSGLPAVPAAPTPFTLAAPARAVHAVAMQRGDVRKDAIERTAAVQRAAAARSGALAAAPAVNRPRRT